MSLPEHLFKASVSLSLDESVFHELLQSVQDRLRAHDEILEKLLRERGGNNLDIDKLREMLRDEFRHELEKLNQRINQLESRTDSLEGSVKALDDKLGSLEKRVDGTESAFANLGNSLDDLTKTVNGIQEKVNKEPEQVQQTHEEEKTITPEIDLEGMEKRLKCLEDNTNATTLKLQRTRDSVQHIASAFASINGTDVSIDGELKRVMKSTADHVIQNFETLFERVNNIGAEISTLGKGGQDIDFDGCSLRPDAPADWRDEPKLPDLNKFHSVENIVDYVYELMPRLQGYLNAMHGRIIDYDGMVANALNRNDLNDLMGSLKDKLDLLEDQIAALRAAFGKVATRNDIVAAVKKAQLGINIDDGSTAIGYVRCIACGSQIPQVAGAMTEEEATEQLGAAPNCLATGPGGRTAMYTNSTDAFDSGRLVESPRSVRPFRASLNARRKIAMPSTPPK